MPEQRRDQLTPLLAAHSGKRICRPTRLSRPQALCSPRWSARARGHHRVAPLRHALPRPWAAQPVSRTAAAGCWPLLAAAGGCCCHWPLLLLLPLAAAAAAAAAGRCCCCRWPLLPSCPTTRLPGCSVAQLPGCPAARGKLGAQPVKPTARVGGCSFLSQQRRMSLTASLAQPRHRLDARPTALTYSPRV